MAANERSEEQTVDRDGYQLTFYPGFCSRATVRGADGTEHELFEQQETYHLPADRKRPDGKHLLRLRGGKHRQDVTLRIDDPELRIARITVELYDTAYEDGTVRAQSSEVETFEISNHAKTCPPVC